ncbi:hypothetical protein [Clostridium psychrophilum]|uniref:hypothetical protein n=1 Tax=Clostridium psychrophilum TaxID=132926 RepID=UPI001C0B191B|nr:hypothetical protein [Clostridium psychrophilum]MBU3180192.1 hypothetical protein [Clostridium psychrophilum]
MSHRHNDCCCCEPVCNTGNSCGTGSGIWIIVILLLVFCSSGNGGFGNSCC